MDVEDLTHEDTVVINKAEELDLAVFGHDYHILVVVGEFEPCHNVVAVDPVVLHESLCVINNHVVSGLAHDCELLFKEGWISSRYLREGNVGGLRGICQFHLLDRQVLSSCIMNRQSTIFTASNQQRSGVVILQRLQLVVEQVELLNDLLVIDVKDAHASRCKTTSENWLGWMSRHTDWLIVSCELVDLIV